MYTSEKNDSSIAKEKLACAKSWWITGAAIVVLVGLSFLIWLNLSKHSVQPKQTETKDNLEKERGSDTDPTKSSFFVDTLISGTIIERSVNPGAGFEPGKPLLTI